MLTVKDSLVIIRNRIKIGNYLESTRLSTDLVPELVICAITKIGHLFIQIYQIAN